MQGRGRWRFLFFAARKALDVPHCEVFHGKVFEKFFHNGQIVFGNAPFDVRTSPEKHRVERVPRREENVLRDVSQKFCFFARLSDDKSALSRVILPKVGVNNPRIFENKVVFPAPFAPRRKVHFPDSA